MRSSQDDYHNIPQGGVFLRLPLPLTVMISALTRPLFSLVRRAVGSTFRPVSVDLREMTLENI